METVMLFPICLWLCSSALKKKDKRYFSANKTIEIIFSTFHRLVPIALS